MQMLPRLLLDTHVLLRWLTDQARLTKEQRRTLDAAVRRAEPVALSAISLLEIALLVANGRFVVPGGLEGLFDEMRGSPAIQMLPLSYEIAIEAAMLRALKDPADQTIVATARLQGLRLVTSDQRIIDSGLVRVIE